MKQDIFILGTTEYAFMLRTMIEQEDQYRVLGHTCSRSQIEKNKAICCKHNAALFPFEELSQITKGKTVRVLNAIGYSNMNDTRKFMFQQCLEFGYEPINYKSDRATILSDVIGKGNIFFPGAYIGTNVKIGDNNVFYAGCVITHDIDICDHNFVAANATVGGVVNIGSNCFIGMGATVKNRIDIADYTLVGAGAYVAETTARGDVVVPPRSITLEKKSWDISLIR